MAKIFWFSTFFEKIDFSFTFSSVLVYGELTGEVCFWKSLSNQKLVKKLTQLKEKRPKIKLETKRNYDMKKQYVNIYLDIFSHFSQLSRHCLAKDKLLIRHLGREFIAIKSNTEKSAKTLRAEFGTLVDGLVQALLKGGGDFTWTGQICSWLKNRINKILYKLKPKKTPNITL